eukprot:CAMPEP_0113514134 /NCGR_PEP_ID=MMETSP0014_2-20120614/40240_1 /TAXON_ID=2857 /ORGANISM="Nitzschia sp." /LENGTH=1247 /DNA_ID=CAMNT_0000410597 /DNA_START=337 /DNA_END=4080 /DNA_ORIENTATION=- /assembly_acc=CAM_ASM_000159
MSSPQEEGEGDIHHPVPGLNAHRHPSSPIAQPKYTFDQVPHVSKTLEGSVIQEVTTREAFKQIMAEMVLLCKEAMKRNKSVRTASKPLSLEYIADRLDVDDPCFGYIVRSKEGHLQGFITVTTFTNWQKNFKWDSLNEVSFYYDAHVDGDKDDHNNDDDDSNSDDGDGYKDDDDSDNMDDIDEDDHDDEDFDIRKPSASSSVSSSSRKRKGRRKSKSQSTKSSTKKTEMKTPPRKSNSNLSSERERRLSSIKKRPKTKRIIDEDGSLAKDLQKTVRLGDPYNEGIVWPRIAEISLLGGLGCGKAMVDLVIEHLEFQRGSPTANYDYIALQATDNSIPFYESRSFVRVGAVTYDSQHPTPHSTPMKSRSTSKASCYSPINNSNRSRSNLKRGDDDVDMDTNGSRSSSPDFTETSISTHGSGADAQVQQQPNMINAVIKPQGIVASPHFQFVVEKPGDTPNDIAKRFKVNVWDVIFLNKDLYPDLRPTSKTHKGTILYVPECTEPDETTQTASKRAMLSSPRTPTRSNSAATTTAAAASAPAQPAASPVKWFVAKENDTPRKIAQQFGVACNKLVAANRSRLPELQANSRLRKGTRIKVSNLDSIDEIAQPYCHWSFPEDTHVEGGDPSYMMVRRLDRKTARHPRFVRNSFAVPVEQYKPPTMLFPPPPKNQHVPIATSHPPSNNFKPDGQQSSAALPRFNPNSTKTTKRKNVKLPKKPQKPPELEDKPHTDGKAVYTAHQKDLHPEFINETPEISKIIHDRWSRLAKEKKERYHEAARQARIAYDRVNDEYQGKIREWKKECKRRQDAHAEENPVQNEMMKVDRTAAGGCVAPEFSLFNSVVKLRSDALEGKEYKYWYVLTYIPDLKWCHLVPMEQQGVFGPERKRSHGRPRFRLVDEKLALELDISSTYCIPVKARALKKSNDADKEEWDVIDDGQPPSAAKPARRLSSGGQASSKKSSSKKKAASAKKPAPVASSNSIASYLADPVSSSNRSSPSRRAPPRKTPRFQVVLSPSSKARKAKSIGRPPTHQNTSNADATSQEIDYHSRDPLKRTRSSPISQSAAVSLDELDTSPVAKPERRHVRRCMRCVENGGSHEQATSCEGRKGRLGRDYCEYFDSKGKVTKSFEEPRSPQRTTPSGRKPRRCLRCVENGMSEDQAIECPGAQGRHGQKACIHFPPQEEQQRTAISANDDAVKTVLFADETKMEVMVDATNRKRKRLLVEESDVLENESNPRKSRRSAPPVSYVE